MEEHRLDDRIRLKCHAFTNIDSWVLLYQNLVWLKDFKSMQRDAGTFEGPE